MMARTHHELLLQIQDSPLWQPESIPDIPLSEEQMISFIKGYAPGWDRRYAPYLLGEWFYITRSGYWLKKFKYEKGKDGLYHVGDHFTTIHEKGRNLLLQVLCEWNYNPRVMDDKLRERILEIESDHSLREKYDAITY